MTERIAPRICDTHDRASLESCFVDAHAPYRPCAFPVRRLYIDPRERSRCRTYIPTALLEARMSKQEGELVSVRIIPNERGKPAGKLADAEVIFEADAGPLSGLKLIGFSVWERRDGGRNVTFPARQYSVNGERRSFALLRPANGDASAQEAIRQCILDAYQRSEAHT